MSNDGDAWTIVLRALPSTRSQRAAGAAPIQITVRNEDTETTEEISGPEEVVPALDRLLPVRIMDDGFSQRGEAPVAVEVECDDDAGITTCRILKSIAAALNTETL